jgi:hypothetical protein
MPTDASPRREDERPAAPMRPGGPEPGELWEDYRAFKAAGLLSEWRRKWRAYLPEPP